MCRRPVVFQGSGREILTTVQKEIYSVHKKNVSPHFVKGHMGHEIFSYYVLYRAQMYTLL